MIDGFDHVGTDHICNVCQSDFTDDEGGIQGYLGILPVAFCPTCFCGLCDMAEQVNDREWEGLTDEEVDEIYTSVQLEVNDHWNKGGTTMMFPLTLYKAFEAKLKEKICL
jgi:hypothetical protein